MIRVGIDVTTVDEVARSLRRFGSRYTNRLFTTGELARADDADRPLEDSLAACFATKEAVLKALGVSGSEIPEWTSIELVDGLAVRPYVQLCGVAANIAANANITQWRIALNRDGNLISAVVVGFGLP